MPSLKPLLLCLDRGLDRVALPLSLVWLLILVLELVGQQAQWLFVSGTLLWLVFLLQYVLKAWTSPDRLKYVSRNFLFGLALTIPLLRFFRVQNELPWVGYLTATSGAQLVWIFGSVNFGMRSLQRDFRRRGVGLVIALTAVVLFVGAAALYNFERAEPGVGLHSYAEALWWTSMQMTTIGSGYSPVTAQGQVVALAISIYACGVFGYLTASLATFFIGQDSLDSGRAAPAPGAIDHSALTQLKAEIAALREELRLRR